MTSGRDGCGTGTSEAAVPLRYDDGELAFFSTVATFGTPLDITGAELAIESFFPADDVTASALRAVDHGRTRAGCRTREAPLGP